jgi:hypothetical protein
MRTDVSWELGINFRARNTAIFKPHLEMLIEKLEAPPMERRAVIGGAGVYAGADPPNARCSCFGRHIRRQTLTKRGAHFPSRTSRSSVTDLHDAHQPSLGTCRCLRYIHNRQRKHRRTFRTAAKPLCSRRTVVCRHCPTIDSRALGYAVWCDGSSSLPEHAVFRACLHCIVPYLWLRRSAISAARDPAAGMVGLPIKGPRLASCSMTSVTGMDLARRPTSLNCQYRADFLTALPRRRC